MLNKVGEMADPWGTPAGHGAVAQATTNINRPLAFLYFEGLFCVGISFGPMIASFLKFNVDILGLTINAGDSPGVILTVVWCLLFILTLFLPSDLAEKPSNDLQEIDLRDREDETASEETPITEAKDIPFQEYVVALPRAPN